MTDDQGGGRSGEVLRKWMKNRVFEAVQAAGFGPEEFVWDSGGADGICLRHQSSGAYFVFGGNASKYIIRYAAGDEPERKVEKYSWQALMNIVGAAAAGAAGLAGAAPLKSDAALASCSSDYFIANGPTNIGFATSGAGVNTMCVGVNAGGSSAGVLGWDWGSGDQFNNVPAGTGVMGTGATYGVYGASGQYGVYGTTGSGYGVYGVSSGGIGGHFDGPIGVWVPLMATVT
jgi:hypothetical protein